jgi:hypothetical protein
MKILLLNQNWFAKELREWGHEVHSIGYTPNMDRGIENSLVPISNYFPAGFVPDLVVVHDHSAPVSLTGLDELQCPIIFVAVDTHLHEELHCQLSIAFDHMFLAHRDYMESFDRRELPRPQWLPAWAGAYHEPAAVKKYESVFVGSFDPERNPERTRFFDELKKLINITVTSGPYGDYFTEAEVVVNQTLRGDLNFRVFESMMCGAALVTEVSGNGLTELFKPGEHLLLYERGNAQDAADRVRELMSDRSLCKRIAEAGRNEVLARHTTRHRAEVFYNAASKVQKKTRSGRLPWMYNYQMLAILLEAKNSFLYGKSLKEAMRFLELADREGEAVTRDVALMALRTMLDFDRTFGGTRGSRLLERLYEANPANPILIAGKIHLLKSAGQSAEAEAFARKIAIQGGEQNLLAASDKAIKSIMAWRRPEGWTPS